MTKQSARRYPRSQSASSGMGAAVKHAVPNLNRCESVLALSVFPTLWERDSRFSLCKISLSRHTAMTDRLDPEDVKEITT